MTCTTVQTCSTVPLSTNSTPTSESFLRARRSCCWQLQVLTAAGAEEPSLAGMPQVTAGVAMSPPSSSAAGSWEAATSPVDDQSEEPSDIKLELLLPRKLKTYDGGWSSDDTKTFDKDRGTEGNTHTHTHCSLFGKVVSFLL
jgi:hypothetical protein